MNQYYDDDTPSVEADSPPECPVCDGLMNKVDIPKRSVYSCVDCKELVQVAHDGSIIPIGGILDLVDVGDDRIRGAISTTRERTVLSILDVMQGGIRARRFEEDASMGAISDILVQVENRMDFAISKLSGPALIMPEVGEAVTALTEVRQRISTRPPQTRGVRKEVINDEPACDGASAEEDGPSE